MNIDNLTIGLTVLLCLVCIVTDLKNGMVRNRYLLLIGVPAVLLNLISGGIRWYREPETFLWQSYALAAAVPALLSVLLYALKIWAGGDCKLYLILIFALPYERSLPTYFEIGPGIWMLLLAFLFGYCFMLAESFWRMLCKRKTGQPGKQQIQQVLRGFLQYLCYYIAMIFVNQMLYFWLGRFSGGDPDARLLFLLDFFVVFLIAKLELLKSPIIVATLLIVDILLGILEPGTIFNRQMLLIWSAVLLSGILRNFADRCNYEEIEPEHLKKGMILSSASSFLLANDRYCKFKKLSDESLRSRLTEEDVLQIQEYGKRKNAPDRVCIVKRIPFALFLGLADLVILTGGTFL
jgi:Flp pilus assembly protein protease CpaA